MAVAAVKSRLKAVPTPTAESAAIETHATSMDGVAAALNALVAEVAAAREQQKPMHDFFADASDALSCFRMNLKKWGPWLIGSIPVVMSLINGVSPQVVKAVAAIVGSIPK